MKVYGLVFGVVAFALLPTFIGKQMTTTTNRPYDLSSEKTGSNLDGQLLYTSDRDAALILEKYTGMLTHDGRQTTVLETHFSNYFDETHKIRPSKDVDKCTYDMYIKFLKNFSSKTFAILRIYIEIEE